MALQYSTGSITSMRRMQIPGRNDNRTPTSAQMRATPHSTSNPSRSRVPQPQYQQPLSSDNVTPDRIGPPYVRTRYVLIYWAGCDDFQNDLEPLEDLFDDFGFEGEYLEIPTDQKDASEFVRKELKRFKSEHPGDNELHIVVYGGHGKAYRPKKSQKEVLLLASDTALTNYVSWNDIQNEVLFKDERDTIFIPDCCYAGAAQRPAYFARKDILAACDANHVTEEGFDEGESSFTALVVKAMRVLYQQRGRFTLQQLHTVLCNLRSSPMPFYQGQGPKREIEFSRQDNGAPQGHSTVSSASASRATQPGPLVELPDATLVEAVRRLLKQGLTPQEAAEAIASRLACSPMDVITRCSRIQQQQVSPSNTRNNERRHRMRSSASDEDDEGVGQDQDDDEEQDEDEEDDDEDEE